MSSLFLAVIKKKRYVKKTHNTPTWNLNEFFFFFFCVFSTNYALEKRWKRNVQFKLRL